MKMDGLHTTGRRTDERVFLDRPFFQFQLPTIMTWKGIAGATALVALTTADDAVWLLKFTSPALPISTRIIHAALFVGTLSALSMGCVGVALLIENAVIAGGSAQAENEDIMMGIVGASICWAIAIGLYVKKTIKRRKRPQQEPTNPRGNGAQYGSIEEGSVIKNLGQDFDDASSSSGSSFDGDDRDIPQTPSVLKVMTLTVLGALDEISYFPALVVGQVFTPLELCVGTFLAAALVVVIVACFLSTFKPLIDFVDKIPLYGIIGVFALVLSIGVIIDIIRG